MAYIEIDSLRYKNIYVGENQLGNEGLKPVLINCPKLEKMNLGNLIII
jgi:hypothetical protein